MGLSIANNISSLTAQNHLTHTQSMLSKSLERLSSGLKINRGGDGPAALVISEQQRAQIAGLQAAIDAPIAEGRSGEINLDARLWARRIAASLGHGYHMAIDYGYLEREFYARPNGTLMCYWRRQAVEDPYIRIGEQDITTHVNFSDLIQAGREASLETVEFSTQMDFLIRLGILDELEPLAQSGAAEAIQRLEAIKKLILPGNMGERFKVLVQRKV